MSKWDKLITRICNLSKDLRFDELRKVLESYGYEMNVPRSGSSHYTFRKSGCMPITIPKHEPIKKVYVEMVREIVESAISNALDEKKAWLEAALEEGVEIHEACIDYWQNILRERESAGISIAYIFFRGMMRYSQNSNYM